uniref:cyclin-dependent kinase inhibitor 1C n=1 Tax=Ictidomys tridecemlineatus TaxID=43179 RepID=UPI001A9DFF7F|nr:cyclin-dependent kinase inhibitor 1C [Ictidomys tridecemlineatus]
MRTSAARSRSLTRCTRGFRDVPRPAPLQRERTAARRSRSCRGLSSLQISSPSARDLRLRSRRAMSLRGVPLLARLLGWAPWSRPRASVCDELVPSPFQFRALRIPGRRMLEDSWASAGTVHVAATRGGCRRAAIGFVFKNLKRVQCVMTSLYQDVFCTGVHWSQGVKL